MYEPKFSFGEMRGDKKSLWVEMPNGELYNIWDVIPEQISDDVLKAIMSSFTRGIEAHRQMIRLNDYARLPLDANWPTITKG